MEADREFRQFSEQLRLHASNLSNLSIGDSIWSVNKNSDERRNLENVAPDWKPGFGGGQKLAFSNTKLDRYNNTNNDNSFDVGGGDKNGSHFLSSYNTNNYNNGGTKNYFEKAVGKPASGIGGGLYGDKRRNYNIGSGKLGGNKKGANISNGIGGNSNGGVDKRFKTLPPEEALPRNEAIGGYIFVCNNDTMQENLRRQLFGLPQRYRDSVRVITPGLPLFLYNYSTHQLHGIFEAASFGGTNIDPTAWEDKKKLGESRFPAQVRVVTRKNCEPLEEDSFRPILHHYDGPKFRLELSVPEALDVLDKFAEQNA